MRCETKDPKALPWFLPEPPSGQVQGEGRQGDRTRLLSLPSGQLCPGAFLHVTQRRLPHPMGGTTTAPTSRGEGDTPRVSQLPSGRAGHHEAVCPSTAAPSPPRARREQPQPLLHFICKASLSVSVNPDNVSRVQASSPPPPGASRCQKVSAWTGLQTTASGKEEGGQQPPAFPVASGWAWERPRFPELRQPGWCAPVAGTLVGKD